MRRRKRLNDVVTDFEGRGTDSGPDPREQLVAGNPKRLHSPRQHASGQAAPTGMGCSNTRPGPVAKQHGQAVGGQHRTDACLSAGGGVVHADVGSRWPPRPPCRLGHSNPMNLIEPERLRGQLERPTQASPILENGCGMITNMGAEIEAGVPAAADTSKPQRGGGPDVGGRRPVRLDPLQVRRWQDAGSNRVSAGPQRPARPPPRLLQAASAGPAYRWAGPPRRPRAPP